MGQIKVDYLDGVPIIMIDGSYGLPPEQQYLDTKKTAEFLLTTESNVNKMVCVNEHGLGDVVLKHGKKSIFCLADLISVRKRMFKPRDPKAYAKMLERIRT